MNAVVCSVCQMKKQHCKRSSGKSKEAGSSGKERKMTELNTEKKMKMKAEDLDQVTGGAISTMEAFNKAAGDAGMTLAQIGTRFEFEGTTYGDETAYQITFHVDGMNYKYIVGSNSGILSSETCPGKWYQ